VLLDTAAGLDVAAERKRLDKDLAAAQADVEAAERKLASRSFVERAPAEIVQKNRDRLASAQDEVRRLTERLAVLQAERA
jgi:valyl-tRNA synthetase